MANRSERRRIARLNTSDREQRRQIATALRLQDEALRDAADNTPGPALDAAGFEVIRPALVLPPGAREE